MVMERVKGQTLILHGPENLGVTEEKCLEGIDVKTMLPETFV